MAPPYENFMTAPGKMCPICRNRLGYRVSVRILPCFHQDSEECMLRWLHLKAVCPILNSNYVFSVLNARSFELNRSGRKGI